MIQIHFWAPTIVYVTEWEKKLNECLDEVVPNFKLLELGPITTYIHRKPFDVEICGPTLDEALFIPFIRQIHIILLTNADILEFDQFRILDSIVHLDSFSRSTRRINNIILDLLTPVINSKLRIKEIKEGFKDLTTLLNSRTVVSDLTQVEHDAPLDSCSVCNLNLKGVFSTTLLQITSELILSELNTLAIKNDSGTYLGPP